jgi:hypothetical protein
LFGLPLGETAMMRTKYSFLAGALFLASAGVPLLAATCTPAPPTNPERAAAEQRFALSFCYSQYRSQDDVTRCLAYYVR